MVKTPQALAGATVGPGHVPRDVPANQAPRSEGQMAGTSPIGIRIADERLLPLPLREGVGGRGPTTTGRGDCPLPPPPSRMGRGSSFSAAGPILMPTGPSPAKARIFMIGRSSSRRATGVGGAPRPWSHHRLLCPSGYSIFLRGKNRRCIQRLPHETSHRAAFSASKDMHTQ